MSVESTATVGTSDEPNLDAMTRESFAASVGTICIQMIDGAD